MELPDDRHTQVMMMMTPAMMSKEFTQERPNSTTRLLAATFTFKVMKKFGDGITQCKLQQQYQVKPKQLALCIMGQKYLGGNERKALARKR